MRISDWSSDVCSSDLLRSLRDKTLAYLERDMGKNHATGFATMLDAVTAYCHCLRAVAKEDRAQLESADLAFNLHTLVAGAQPEDDEPSLFLVYPAGHWIEVDRRPPSIGRPSCRARVGQ